MQKERLAASDASPVQAEADSLDEHERRADAERACPAERLLSMTLEARARHRSRRSRCGHPLRAACPPRNRARGACGGRLRHAPRPRPPPPRRVTLLRVASSSWRTFRSRRTTRPPRESSGDRATLRSELALALRPECSPSAGTERASSRTESLRAVRAATRGYC